MYISFLWGTFCRAAGILWARNEKELYERHDYTIGTLDVLQACDACADMGIAYSVIVQCADCVVFPYEKLVLTGRLEAADQEKQRT